jgi:hypothetical protein
MLLTKCHNLLCWSAKRVHTSQFDKRPQITIKIHEIEQCHRFLQVQQVLQSTKLDVRLNDELMRQLLNNFNSFDEGVQFRHIHLAGYCRLQHHVLLLPRPFPVRKPNHKNIITPQIE